MREIKKIGVIGAGIMGQGIALVSAMNGYDVILNDIGEEFVEEGIEKIEKFLGKSIEIGKITEVERKRILSKIENTIKLEDIKDCDFIIEAISENIALKKELFKKLDKICPKRVIFASNTSTISITELGLATKRPEKFVGMHFFNPVPLMKLVEIVKGKRTSKETIKKVRELAEKLGKTPLLVNDSPGFVSNRILFPMINEAIYCLMEGVAKKESIDEVMKIGMNHPMGPLELADLIGLDICLSILEELKRGFANKKYDPCPLLKKMVKKGYLGRKIGRGFYDYKE